MRIQTTTNGRSVNTRNEVVNIGDHFMHPQYGKVKLTTFDGRQGTIVSESGEEVPIGVVSLKLLKKV